MQPAVPSGTDDAGNEADVSLSDHLSLRLLNKKSYSVGEFIGQSFAGTVTPL